jgi:hypothetical protein
MFGLEKSTLPWCTFFSSCNFFLYREFYTAVCGLTLIHIVWSLLCTASFLLIPEGLSQGIFRAAAKVTKYFCSWHHLPCNSHYMIAVYFFCIWDIYCNGNSDIHGWCTLTMDDSVKLIALCSDRTIRMFLLWWIIMIILLYWSTLKNEILNLGPHF